jgi:hypothetical protein
MLSLSYVHRKGFLLYHVEFMKRALCSIQISFSPGVFITVNTNPILGSQVQKVEQGRDKHSGIIQAAFAGCLFKFDIHQILSYLPSSR